MSSRTNRTRQRRASVAIAAIIALAGVGALTGCGADVGGLVNGVVQDASGGEVSLGGALPSGWPAEVPVIDGELLFGAGAAADASPGWVVTVKSSASDPLTDARTQLEDAGFTVDAAAQGAEAGVLTTSNGTYTVVVAGTTDGLLYTVAEGDK